MLPYYKIEVESDAKLPLLSTIIISEIRKIRVPKRCTENDVKRAKEEKRTFQKEKEAKKRRKRKQLSMFLKRGRQSTAL